MICSAPADEGRTIHCKKVVIFTGLVETSGALQQEQLALRNLELEVVFVIDTTPSMEPLIEIAREVIQNNC